MAKGKIKVPVDPPRKPPKDPAKTPTNFSYLIGIIILFLYLRLINA